MLDFAQRVLETPRVFVDVETTGLEPTKDKIVEIALHRVGDRDQCICGLVDPGFPMPDGARRVHNITDAMITEGGVSQEWMAREIRESGILDDAIIVGHNVTFDVGFLAALVGATTVWGAPAIDTVSQAMCAFPGLQRYSLQGLRQHFAIQANTAHRAVEDVGVLEALFEEIITKRGTAVQCWELMACWENPAPAPTVETFSTLYTAIAMEERVTFAYQKPDGLDAEERHVTPAMIRYERGRCMLTGHDHMRDESRTFRLDRMVTVPRFA